MKLGSINATGTAVVKIGNLSFPVTDTPRAIGCVALAAGAQPGDTLTVTTNYPGFGRETRKYVLILDGGMGFADRF